MERGHSRGPSLPLSPLLTPQADLTAALFVREGNDAPTATTLFDMQHMWYEVAAGACHWRRGELGKVRLSLPFCNGSQRPPLLPPCIWPP